MMAQILKPIAGGTWLFRAGTLAIALGAIAMAFSGTAAQAREETWIVLDAASGTILNEHNADVVNYPASLTKMMTLYLAFEALEARRISFDTPFIVSEHAAIQAPSKLGLIPGDTISVRDLILGMVTKSANDAAVVMAEGLAGSEEAFAARMTVKARALGMGNTVFRNASGLPNPDQYTTARDLSRLAIALYRNFPREYVFFSTESFSYNGRIFETHNHLMEAFQGMDGIKTGFINAAGFNLAASAVRNNHRLVGVIMGGRSARSRDMDMAALLDDAFGGRSAPAMEVAGLRPPQTYETFTRRAEQVLMPIAHAAAATSEDMASAAQPNPVHLVSSRQAVDYRVKLADRRPGRNGVHVARSGKGRHGRYFAEASSSHGHGHGVRLAAAHGKQRQAHNTHTLRHGTELAAVHSTKRLPSGNAHTLRHGVELAAAQETTSTRHGHDFVAASGHGKMHGRYAVPDHSAHHAVLAKTVATNGEQKAATSSHRNKRLHTNTSAKNHFRSNGYVKHAHGRGQLKTACHDSSGKNHHRCIGHRSGQIAVRNHGGRPGAAG